MPSPRSDLTDATLHDRMRAMSIQKEKKTTADAPLTPSQLGSLLSKLGTGKSKVRGGRDYYQQLAAKSAAAAKRRRAAERRKTTGKAASKRTPRGQ